MFRGLGFRVGGVGLFMGVSQQLEFAGLRMGPGLATPHARNPRQAVILHLKPVKRTLRNISFFIESRVITGSYGGHLGLDTDSHRPFSDMRLYGLIYLSHLQVGSY